MFSCRELWPLIIVVEKKENTYLGLKPAYDSWIRSHNHPIVNISRKGTVRSFLSCKAEKFL